VERFDYEWKILRFIDTEFNPSNDNKKGDDGKIEENVVENEVSNG